MLSQKNFTEKSNSNAKVTGQEHRKRKKKLQQSMQLHVIKNPQE
jgi:hypothetical protein